MRAELGRQQLSYRRFALMAGVSYAWLNRRISSGETDLTVEDIQLVADALRVRPERLVRGWLPRFSPRSTDDQERAGQTGGHYQTVGVA